MNGGTDSPFTVGWVLFGLKGRIGRKSFWLSALLVLLVQAIIIAQIVGIPEESPAYPIWGLVILASWIISAWVALALAVKRLHDLGLPGILAVTVLIPGLQFVAFLVLAFLPSKQETNEHGPPPFPRS